ncbi:MAG: hypothetical protein ACK5PP_07550 [Acidimicrobiales bacterium]
MTAPEMNRRRALQLMAGAGAWATMAGCTNPTGDDPETGGDDTGGTAVQQASSDTALDAPARR